MFVWIRFWLFALRFKISIMPNISEQKVVVVCDFSERMKDVIVHGVRMADILKKELCLLAIWKDKSQKGLFQEKMELTINSLKSNLPGVKISSLSLPKSLYENIDRLTNVYEAVLIIMHQSDIKVGLKAFRESSVAFLFVNGSLPEFLRYKNVLLSVDYRKASKEISLWASYMGRFNKSKICLVYASETDSDHREKLGKNLDFIKKFLSSLNVSHYVVGGNSSSWGIFDETLTRAPEWNGDVMLFAGSMYISLIDRIIGLPEEKIIRKAGNLPILIINPRKDVCIMCD